MADIFNRRRTGKILDVMPFRHQEWIDEPDGTVSLTTFQDAQPTVEQNRLEFNNFGDRLTPGKRGDLHKVASIPFVVWEQWKKETNGAIEKDIKLLNKYLNDPDNKYFRTAPTNL
jgi:hypothetical protein